MRAAIERLGGREAKTTGDGFFVLFHSPARAVRGAAAIIDAATAHGLTARAAVHAGEVELQGDEVRGIAVHATARILDVAKPGEVLVSTTARDLLTGSGSYLPTVASSSSAASTGAADWQRWFASYGVASRRNSVATARHW